MVTGQALSDPVGLWTIRSAEANRGAEGALNKREARLRTVGCWGTVLCMLVEQQANALLPQTVGSLSALSHESFSWRQCCTPGYSMGASKSRVGEWLHHVELVKDITT